MEIIPVVDVRMGLAVRAVAGDRTRYHPLETPLAQGADPVTIAAGFRRLYPFRTFYIADLDGIEGRGANTALAQSLWRALPDASFWIDSGDPRPMPEPRLVRVIGSESVGGDPSGLQMREEACVLSLDFRGDDFIGPSRLLEDAGLWPQRIIVMTLARVGTDEGPDFSRVASIARRAGSSRQIYAAGGVRDRSHLVRLRDVGATGALVASALHAGKIKTGDLEEIAGI